MDRRCNKVCIARNSYIGTGLILVALAFTVGCQGFSSAKQATTTTTQPAQAGTLALSSSSLNFGTVKVGDKQQMSETLTNTGGASLSISQIAVTGTGFSLSTVSTPITIAPGQSTSFEVTFSPQSAGSASGSVTIASSVSSPSLALVASGTLASGQLTATPASLAVGNVVVGDSGAASGSLNASGTNVTITAATSNNSRFTISGLSLPVVITAGQSAPFTVTFSPQISGAASATLTFTSDAQTSTTTAAATGTGTAAPTHTVDLSWSPSASPNIAGYNIYRAIYTSACGGYSKINGSSLDTATHYSDSTVSGGTNYCYATTAVNTSNEESGYSNIVADVQVAP